MHGMTERTSCHHACVHGIHTPPACAQIVATVQPQRERLDACLIFPSMPAVMRLNKLGTFNMAQLGQSKSPFAEFMRSARKNSDNFEVQPWWMAVTVPLTSCNADACACVGDLLLGSVGAMCAVSPQKLALAVQSAAAST